MIITTDENHRQIDGFDCVAASHPVPDGRGLCAAEKIIDLVTPQQQMTICCLNQWRQVGFVAGTGGSISLEQKIALNDALLASGLDIHDMNVVRRLFSD